MYNQTKLKLKHYLFRFNSELWSRRQSCVATSNCTLSSFLNYMYFKHILSKFFDKDLQPTQSNPQFGPMILTISCDDLHCIYTSFLSYHFSQFTYTSDLDIEQLVHIHVIAVVLFYGCSFVLAFVNKLDKQGAF